MLTQVKIEQLLRENFPDLSAKHGIRNRGSIFSYDQLT